jgi:hypothetical protein
MRGPRTTSQTGRQQYPCGQTRREFLWEAGGGFAGTALAYLLAQDGFFGRARATEAADARPLALKNPHFEPRAKAAIFLFMNGGPSQVDLWDPKPELTRRHGQPLAAADSDPLLKARKPGNLMASKYLFRKWGECGTEVSELLPYQAQIVDELAVVRSLYADSFAHGSGLLQMNTGFLRQGYPSLGAWLSYGLGTVNQDLPAFVVMLDPRGGPISGPANWGSGFIPAAYQGTQFRSSGPPIINLTQPEAITVAQRRNQLDLLGQYNRWHAEASPENTELAARIASYELAFRMQARAPAAVDLSGETAETKRLYGLDNPVTEPFGRQCLLARRLVERGVRFVQVYSGGGHNDQNWDAHTDVNKNHEMHCAESDLPAAGLILDLKRRGLLDQTLVIWAGEFGRTPTAQGSKGRDHNPRGFSGWLAGGGVQGGRVIGATDEFGYYAVENRIHVHDLHATILHLMGLDHTLLTFFHGGRNYRLTDVSGRVVEELWA